MFERHHVDLGGYRRRAVFSADARHPRLPLEARRLVLEIELQPGALDRADARRVVFCMLNPSTATEATNDPTVTRCCGFAAALGADVLVVVNIFDWRDTDPKAMRGAEEPSGPANDAAIIAAALGAHAVICGWGRNGAHRGRGAEVRRMLRELGVRLYWLRDPRKFSANEEPLHPLYLHGSCRPAVWHDADEHPDGRCDCKPL